MCQTEGGGGGCLSAFGADCVMMGKTLRGGVDIEAIGQLNNNEGPQTPAHTSARARTGRTRSQGYRGHGDTAKLLGLSLM